MSAMPSFLWYFSFSPAPFASIALLALLGLPLLSWSPPPGICFWLVLSPFHCARGNRLSICLLQTQFFPVCIMVKASTTHLSKDWTFCCLPISLLYRLQPSPLALPLSALGVRFFHFLGHEHTLLLPFPSSLCLQPSLLLPSNSLLGDRQSTQTLLWRPAR